VTPEQRDAATAWPHLFKPVILRDRNSYYDKVRRRFNAIPDLLERDQLPPDFGAAAVRLSDFWAAIDRHIQTLQIGSRAEIAQLAFFLSDVVFNWPAPQVSWWIRAHERASADGLALRRFQTVVGWGTGAAFKSTHQHIGRELAFVIDRDLGKRGQFVESVEVRTPDTLCDLDPRQTAVVVFSCYVDEIRAAVRAHGDYNVFVASEIVSNRSFRPVADLVEYFREVEQYYPVLFAA
jgi:hypothetical protein